MPYPVTPAAGLAKDGDSESDVFGPGKFGTVPAWNS